MLYDAQYIGPMQYRQSHIAPILCSLEYIGLMMYPREYSISPTAIHQATVPCCQCGLLPGIMLIRDVCCRLAFGMVSHTQRRAHYILSEPRIQALRVCVQDVRGQQMEYLKSCLLRVAFRVLLHCCSNLIQLTKLENVLLTATHRRTNSLPLNSLPLSTATHKRCYSITTSSFPNSCISGTL
jgi:hypothetical protein